MTSRWVSMSILLLLTLATLGAGASAQEKREVGKPAKIKVAFAPLSTIHDLGWTTAHYRGIEYLKKTMKDQVSVSYTENVLAADTERVVRGYTKSGHEIVFATTFEYMDPTLIVAKDFPKTAFEHLVGYKTGPNMGNYFARMEQSE